MYAYTNAGMCIHMYVYTLHRPHPYTGHTHTHCTMYRSAKIVIPNVGYLIKIED